MNELDRGTIAQGYNTSGALQPTTPGNRSGFGLVPSSVRRNRSRFQPDRSSAVRGLLELTFECGV